MAIRDTVRGLLPTVAPVHHICCPDITRMISITAQRAGITTHIPSAHSSPRPWTRKQTFQAPLLAFVTNKRKRHTLRTLIHVPSGPAKDQSNPADYPLPQKISRRSSLNKFHQTSKQEGMGSMAANPITRLSSPSDYRSFLSKFDTFLLDCDGPRPCLHD